MAGSADALDLGLWSKVCWIAPRAPKEERDCCANRLILITFSQLLSDTPL